MNYDINLEDHLGLYYIIRWLYYR